MGKNDGDYECRVASSSALGTKHRVHQQQQHLIRFQITTFNTTTMGTNSTEYGAVLLLLHSSRP